jgi:hypothetical protein
MRLRDRPGLVVGIRILNKTNKLQYQRALPTDPSQQSTLFFSKSFWFSLTDSPIITLKSHFEYVSIMSDKNQEFRENVNEQA